MLFCVLVIIYALFYWCVYNCGLICWFLMFFEFKDLGEKKKLDGNAESVFSER